MSEKAFDIQEYMTHGVERVVREAIKATLKNPKESVFMARFAAASKAASKKRRKAEDAGEHIPRSSLPASPANATCTARAAIPAATMPRWTRLR